MSALQNEDILYDKRTTKQYRVFTEVDVKGTDKDPLYQTQREGLVTSSQKKKLPTHVHVKDESSGLSDDSIVMLEQIRTIDKQRLCSMIGHVSDKTMALIEDAALCSLGIVR